MSTSLYSTPVISDADCLYKSIPSLIKLTLSVDCANQYANLSSMLLKSAATNLYPFGAHIARLSSDDLGRFCRLIPSTPLHLCDTTAPEYFSGTASNPLLAICIKFSVRVSSNVDLFPILADANA